MAEPSSDSDLAIDFEGDNVIFSPRDEELLGLFSPAPVNEVVDRAWDYLGRYQQHKAELSLEVRGIETAALGSSKQQSKLRQQIYAAEQDIARLQMFCQEVGAVSLHGWASKQEK